MAGAGSALALLVLNATATAFESILPTTFTSYVVPVFDIRVLLFAMIVAATSAAVAGIVPAWRASRVDLVSVLQRGTNRAGSGRLRGSASLLAIEIGFSTVLVMGAILMGRTLSNIKGLDVGFDTDRLLTVAVNLPPVKDKTLLLRQFSEILEALRATPGVDAATGADSLPIVGVVNRPLIKGTQVGQRCPVTDGFVETLGMRVVAGRTITAEDLRSGASVGLLSVDGLKLVWPEVSPQLAIGKSLELPDELPREIVGIVTDVRFPYLAPAIPTLYLPIGSGGLNGMLFALRMKPGYRLTPMDVERQVKATGVKPDSVGVGIVADDFASAVVDQTFRARLFAGFGLLAILVAVIGVYSVQSFTLALRRTEFGIRSSLGATPSHLIRLLLKETLRPALVGVTMGLVVGHWASRFLESFLYGIKARDPMTSLEVAVLLMVVVGTAVWLTARQAAHADPAAALRTY
jgi:hypothetical protein